eukprot:m.588829 g.588829  ORF g.588829 m.588829 type:complete len:927 (-) comp22367_c0_seq7:326-3106(-)
MGSPTTPSHVDALLSSAVVRWFGSFSSPSDTSVTSLDDIVYGNILYEVAAQLDQRLQLSIPGHIRHGRDKAELRLSSVLEAVINFYQNELHIIILMELPIISVIFADPSSEAGVDHLRRLLLLIVGCAVQGENQQKYIDDIMGLEASEQMEIMESIQSLMQSQLSTMWDTLEDLSKDALIDKCELAYRCLTQAVTERDAYAVKLAIPTHSREGAAVDTPKTLGGGSVLCRGHVQNDETTLTISVAEHQKNVKSMQAKINFLSETVEAKDLAIQDLVQLDEANRKELVKQANKYRKLQADQENVTLLHDEVELWKQKLEDLSKTTVSRDLYDEQHKSLKYQQQLYGELQEQTTLLEKQVSRLQSRNETSDGLEAHLSISTNEILALRAELASLSAQYTASVDTIEQLKASVLTLSRERDHALADLREAVARVHARETMHDASFVRAAGAVEASSKTQFLKAQGEIADLKAALLEARSSKGSDGVDTVQQRDVYVQTLVTESAATMVSTASQTAQQPAMDLSAVSKDFQLMRSKDEVSTLRTTVSDLRTTVSTLERKLQDAQDPENADTSPDTGLERHPAASKRIAELEAHITALETKLKLAASEKTFAEDKSDRGNRPRRAGKPLGSRLEGVLDTSVLGLHASTHGSPRASAPPARHHGNQHPRQHSAHEPNLAYCASPTLTPVRPSRHRSGLQHARAPPSMDMSLLGERIGLEQMLMEGRLTTLARSPMLQGTQLTCEGQHAGQVYTQKNEADERSRKAIEFLCSTPQRPSADRTVQDKDTNSHPKSTDNRHAKRIKVASTSTDAPARTPLVTMTNEPSGSRARTVKPTPTHLRRQARRTHAGSDSAAVAAHCIDEALARTTAIKARMIQKHRRADRALQRTQQPAGAPDGQPSRAPDKQTKRANRTTPSELVLQAVDLSESQWAC